MVVSRCQSNFLYLLCDSNARLGPRRVPSINTSCVWGDGGGGCGGVCVAELLAGLQHDLVCLPAETQKAFSCDWTHTHKKTLCFLFAQVSLLPTSATFWCPLTGSSSPTHRPQDWRDRTVSCGRRVSIAPMWSQTLGHSPDYAVDTCPGRRASNGEITCGRRQTSIIPHHISMARCASPGGPATNGSGTVWLRPSSSLHATKVTTDNL